MATLTVTLTPEQTAQVEQLLSEGWFSSVEEALAHSIDLLSREAHVRPELTPSARARIEEGIQAARRGEVVSQDEIAGFFSDWERDLRA